MTYHDLSLSTNRHFVILIAREESFRDISLISHNWEIPNFFHANFQRSVGGYSVKSFSLIDLEEFRPGCQILLESFSFFFHDNNRSRSFAIRNIGYRVDDT